MWIALLSTLKEWDCCFQEWKGEEGQDGEEEQSSHRACSDPKPFLMGSEVRSR